MTEKMTLTQILRKYFKGPFLLRCVSMGTKEKPSQFPLARKLLPVNSEERQKLADALELDPAEIPLIFPVGAFFPKVGRTYNCFVRLRRKGGRLKGIVEAVPQARLTLAKEMVWCPQITLLQDSLTFEKDSRGKWFARHHPQTGQYVLVYDWDLSPGEDGKAQVAPGAISLRPAMTRTFLIAGDPEKVKAISEFALEKFQEPVDEKERFLAELTRFSWCPQFPIMEMPLTPFEVLGDFTGGAIDISTFQYNADLALENFQKWERDTLRPVLQPETIQYLGLSEEEKIRAGERIMKLGSETAGQLVEMTKWYSEWLKWYLGELQRRLAFGTLKKIAIPQPAGRKHREGFCLVNLSKEELARMAIGVSVPKPSTPPKPKPTTTRAKSAPPSKPKPPQTTTAYGEKPKNTLGDNPQIRAKLEAMKRRGQKSPELEEEKPKPGQNFRFIPCICGKRHRITDPNFRGNSLEECPKKKGKK